MEGGSGNVVVDGHKPISRQKRTTAIIAMNGSTFKYTTI
jgi:hypothetical protein